MQAVELRNGKTGYEITDDQIVDPHSTLAEAEEPSLDEFSIEPVRLYSPHLEARPQRFIHRPASTMAKASAEPVDDPALVLRCVGCLKTVRLELRGDEGVVLAFGLANPHEAVSRVPRQVEVTLIRRAPCQNDRGCLEH